MNNASYYVKIALAMVPCLAAMYLLFWLEQSGTWIPETPHRDKITVVIVAIGMIASYFGISYVQKSK